MNRKIKRLLIAAPLLILSFSGCKEALDESQFEIKSATGDFVIQMSVCGPDTKTAIADDKKTVYFEVGDQVNVFHTTHSEDEAYGQYANDGCFTVTEVNDGVATLTGNLSEDLSPSKKYDWFAAYPYNEESTNPENIRVSFPTNFNVSGDLAQVLAGNNCPLAGDSKNVAYDATPTLKMHQLSSIFQLNVTNWEEDDEPISIVELNSPEVLAGEFIYDIHTYKPREDDFMYFQHDDEFGDFIENYKTKKPRYTVVSTVEGKHKVSVSVSEVVAEYGESVPVYVPVAPTTFGRLGSSLSVRVNDCYKPVSMKPVRSWYIPYEMFYLRHILQPGRITSFGFNYTFSDIENTPSVWSNLKEGSSGYYSIPSWMYNSSSSFMSYLACTGTVPTQDLNDHSYIWLQSNGYANPRTIKNIPNNNGNLVTNRLPYAFSIWEDEGFVFVIPVKHLSAGSTVAIETALMASAQQMVKNEHLDNPANKPEDFPDMLASGGAAYFRCEFSTDFGKTWTDAVLQSEYAISGGPEGANFCISKEAAGESIGSAPHQKLMENSGCYAKALYTIPFAMDHKTLLYRMRCVNASFCAKDVIDGAAMGSRHPNTQLDQYSEPDTYSSWNSFAPLDGSVNGVYAKVSVEQ